MNMRDSYTCMHVKLNVFRLGIHTALDYAIDPVEIFKRGKHQQQQMYTELAIQVILLCL